MSQTTRAGKLRAQSQAPGEGSPSVADPLSSEHQELGIEDDTVMVEAEADQLQQAATVAIAAEQAGNPTGEPAGLSQAPLGQSSETIAVRALPPGEARRRAEARLRELPDLCFLAKTAAERNALREELESLEKVFHVVDGRQKRPRHSTSDDSDGARPLAKHEKSVRDCIKSQSIVLDTGTNLPGMRRLVEHLSSIETALRKFGIWNKEPLQWPLIWWILGGLRGPLAKAAGDWARQLEDEADQAPTIKDLQEKLKAQIESPAHALYNQIISPNQLAMGDKERITTYRTRWQAKMQEIPTKWSLPWTAQISFILPQLRKGLAPEMVRSAVFSKLEDMEQFWHACLDAEAVVDSRAKE